MKNSIAPPLGLAVILRARTCARDYTEEGQLPVSGSLPLGVGIIIEHGPSTTAPLPQGRQPMLTSRLRWKDFCPVGVETVTVRSSGLLFGRWMRGLLPGRTT
jgi:hypothetical protein